MFRPHWVCPAQGCLCFPVYTAQAPGCSIWSGPCVECGSSFRVLHSSADSVAPACCVFPASAARAARGLRALSPGVARLFPPRRAVQAARGPGALSPVRRAFSLCGPSAPSWLLSVGIHQDFILGTPSYLMFWFFQNADKSSPI